MKKSLIKFTAIFLLTVFCFTNFTPKANAQWAVFDGVNYVINGLKTAAQYLTNLSLGLPGGNVGIKRAVNFGKKPCSAIKEAYEVYNVADVIPTVEVLNASAGEAAKLTAKITALTSVKRCFQVVISLLEDGGADTAAVATGILGELSLNATLAELKEQVRQAENRIDRLAERRSDAMKRMWEGVATRIFLTAQNRLVTTLVNKLIAKYKIGNYLNYADALTAQVYNIEFARKNYPNQLDQAILKSVMQGANYSMDVSPVIRTKARKNLGIDFRTLDTSDPNFFAKMSVVGYGENDPYVLTAFYDSLNDGLQASARESARQELAQGQGIMSLRDCRGIISQERAFDNQWDLLNSDVEFKYKAYLELLNTQSIYPERVSQQDVDKAEADWREAEEKIYSFPQRNGNVFAKRCEDILNPGASISNQITAYLQSHLIAANTTDQKNLPFIAKFAEVVATSFITRIVEHGINQGFNLTGSGFEKASVPLTSVITTDTTARTLVVAENNSVAQSGLLTVSTGIADGQVVLNWDVNSIEGATNVTITGSGGYSYASATLNGSVVTNAPGGSSFTLVAKNASGETLSSSVAVVGSVPSTTVNFTDLPDANDQDNLINGIKGNLNGNGSIPPPPPTTPNTTPDGSPIVWNGTQGIDSQNRVWGLDSNGNLILISGNVQGAYISRLGVNARGVAPNFGTITIR
ncbi:MAG: hypothetical protein JNN11_04530 [Candidatus Doudnabacteria bacterium]|nr:hypothetical protein [Candidatus Doudnabacteria bacterium]